MSQAPTISYFFSPVFTTGQGDPLMEQLIHKVVKDLKTRISAKYKLHEMRVFASSARGDRRVDSDIDMFVHLSQVNRLRRRLI